MVFSISYFAVAISYFTIAIYSFANAISSFAIAISHFAVTVAHTAAAVPHSAVAVPAVRSPRFSHVSLFMTMHVSDDEQTEETEAATQQTGPGGAFSPIFAC